VKAGKKNKMEGWKRGDRRFRGKERRSGRRGETETKITHEKGRARRLVEKNAGADKDGLAPAQEWGRMGTRIRRRWVQVVTRGSGPAGPANFFRYPDEIVFAKPRGRCPSPCRFANKFQRPSALVRRTNRGSAGDEAAARVRDGALCGEIEGQSVRLGDSDYSQDFFVFSRGGHPSAATDFFWAART